MSKPVKRKPGRPEGPKTRAINIRLPIDLLAAVDSLVVSEGRTLTEIVRRALVNYVVENGGDE